MHRLKWLILAIFGALAGAISFILYRRYQGEISVARRRTQAGSQIAETGVGPIEYATSGEGPPVLVIHGATGGYDQGMFLARMMEKGYRGIAMSRFGYLGTPLPEDASSVAQADAHAALLDVLGISRTVVVGVSAGGLSALQFVLRYPQRCQALVLISAVTRPIRTRVAKTSHLNGWFFRSDILAWAFLTILRPVILRQMGLPEQIRAQLPSDQQDWLRGYLDLMLPVSQKYQGLRNDILQISTMELYPLQDIRVPTLVIHAVDDNLVVKKHSFYAAEAIPGAQLLSLPSGGHLLLGQHEVVKSELSAFLGRHGNWQYEG